MIFVSKSFQLERLAILSIKHQLGYMSMQSSANDTMKNSN